MTGESIAAGGIYAITNTISGRVYVGSATCFKKRWHLHLSRLRNVRHENSRLQKAFAKYGEAAFEFSILEIVGDLSTLLQREQHWLDVTKASKDGYNIAAVAGSRTGILMTEESRAKMSASAKGRVISPEHRAKLSAAMKAHVRTPEHCANIGTARKGKKMPNISAAKKGVKRTPEAIEAHRQALTGRKQPADEIARRVATMTGQKRSLEARANMSRAAKERHAKLRQSRAND